MAKPIMQDIVARRPVKTARSDAFFSHKHMDGLGSAAPRSSGDSGSVRISPPYTRKRKYLYIGLATTVFVSFFIISSAFASVHLAVYPRTLPVSFDGTFSAVKSVEPVADAIRFETIEVSAERTASLPLTGTIDAKEKAVAEVILYNDFSSAPQQLVVGTRLETVSKKIYKIEKGVTIPGNKKDGKTTIPGSVAVRAIASEPGASYNGSLGRMSIPGFAGTAKAGKIYAEGKTPATGGFTGKVPSADQNLLASEEKRLLSEVKAELSGQIERETPQGFVSYPDTILYATTVHYPKAEEVTGDTYPLRVTISAEAPLFRLNDLSRVVSQVDPKSRAIDGEVLLGAPEKITARLVNKESLDLKTINGFLVRLSGSDKLIWQFDPDVLTQALAGKRLSEESRNQVLSAYPMIVGTEVSRVLPPWALSFPSDTARITLEIDPNRTN